MPGVLEETLVKVEASARESLRDDRRTVPAEAADPAPSRSGRWWVFVGLTLAVVLAFAGGMTATLLYDRMVATPQPLVPADLLEQPEPEPVPAPPTAPELTPEQRRALDVQQALADLRATLPPAAVVEVEVRVDGGAVFLGGRVDTRETLDHAAAVAGAVRGVVAVDTRGLRIESRLHTVQSGELLSDIAKKYYGRAELWPRIVKANPGLDPNRVRPGTAIRVPSTASGD